MQRSSALLPSIKKRSDFLALRQSPRFSCDSFILQGNLASNGDSTPRVGYTVTKKIGNSVVRTRIKRRLRHAVAEAFDRYVNSSALDTNEMPHGTYCGDMVIVARRSVLGEDYAQLVAKLTKGIDRLVTKGNKAA